MSWEGGKGKSAFMASVSPTLSVLSPFICVRRMTIFDKNERGKKQHWWRQIDVLVRYSVRPCLIYIWCRTPVFYCVSQCILQRCYLTTHNMISNCFRSLHKCINDLPFPAKEQPKDESKPLPPKVKGISRFFQSTMQPLYVGYICCNTFGPVWFVQALFFFQTFFLVYFPRSFLSVFGKHGW